MTGPSKLCDRVAPELAQSDTGGRRSLCGVVLAGVFVGATVLAATACTNPVDACAVLRTELEKKYWPSKDASPEFCRRELATVRDLARNYDSLLEWYTEVPQQKVDMLIRLVEATVAEPPLFEFSRFPSEVPCNAGVALSEGDCASSPLGQLGLDCPERVFFSFEIQRLSDEGDEPPLVAFRAIQDLDCDGTRGVTETVGYVNFGLPFYEGGYHRVSNASPDRISE